jgi:PAS domain-containing protein
MQNDDFFQTHKVSNLLADIFDDLPGFVYFVKDVEQRYVAFNKRLLEIFDVEDPADILGKRDNDFMPPNLFKEILKDDILVLETGESIINRVELVPRGNGFVDWSTTTKKPLLNMRMMSVNTCMNGKNSKKHVHTMHYGTRCRYKW